MYTFGKINKKVDVFVIVAVTVLIVDVRSDRIMKVAILVGGYGTRISEEQNCYLKSLYREYDSNVGQEVCKILRDKVRILHH